MLSPAENGKFQGLIKAFQLLLKRCFSTVVSKVHNNRTILFFIETGKCITEVRGSLDIYLYTSPTTWTSSYFLFTTILNL